MDRELTKFTTTIEYVEKDTKFLKFTLTHPLHNNVTNTKVEKH